MNLSSVAFENGGKIPVKYTCDGENINPALSISGVPENAQSLVLIVDDPDSPSGMWVHWTLWNIDPRTTQIAENTIPAESKEGETDFGSVGYGGPCPHSGEHRYMFKLYALDTNLELASSAKKIDIEKAMQGHILAETKLMGLYKRE